MFSHNYCSFLFNSFAYWCFFCFYCLLSCYPKQINALKPPINIHREKVPSMKLLEALLILSLLLLTPTVLAQELSNNSVSSTVLGEGQDCLGYLLFLPAFVKGETVSLIEVDAGSDSLRDALLKKSTSLNGNSLLPFSHTAKRFAGFERSIGHNLKIAVQRESLSEQFNETIENAKGILGIRPGSEQDLEFEVGPRVYGVVPSTLLNISSEQAQILSKKGFLLECNKRVKASTPVIPTQIELEQAIRGTQPDSLVPDSLKHLTGKGVTIAIIGSGIDYTSPEFGECKKEDFKETEYVDLGRKGYRLIPEISGCEKIPIAINFWEVLREVNSPFYGLFGVPSKEYKTSDVEDDFGLSTPLASIAAGNLSGIAKDAKLHVIKATDDIGFAGYSTLIDALEFVADPNQDLSFEGVPQIILMNFDFGKKTGTVGEYYFDQIKLYPRFLSTVGNSLIIMPSGDTPEKAKIEKMAGNTYILTTGAVYNNSYGEAILYQDCSDENPQGNQLLCVSGKGPTSQKIESGPEWWDPTYLQGRNCYIVKPDLVAPADYLCGAKSTFVTEENVESICKEEQEAISGTLPASAVTTGFAALLKQQHSDWSPLELKSALREGANWISGFGYGLNEQGHGKINIQNSLEMHDYPPIAVMDSIVDNKITGLGTVRPETDFKSYKIELGKGENPVEWIELVETENMPEIKTYSAKIPLGVTKVPRTTGYQILYENLNPEDLEDGFYTLKLTVESVSGQSATDFLQFAVKDGKFTGPETPLEALLETGSGEYYEFGFDRTIFTHEFGEISESTCDFSTEHPVSVGEAGHFCDGYQSLIAIVKKLQGYESQGLGENQSIVEFQAFLVGDTYTESFKDFFQERFAEHLESLPPITEWSVMPGTVQTGLYNIKVIADVVEGASQYSNVRITFTQEKTLQELDSKQGTSYSENLFLAQRTPDTIVNLEGESIPLMRTEEKRINLDKEHFGIGVIEAVNRIDPYEMQDGVILKITKIGEEEGIPHYKIQYTESMPVKMTIGGGGAYYQILQENEHKENIVKWDNIPIETLTDHIEGECEGWNEPLTVDYLKTSRPLTAKAYLSNGTIVRFLCTLQSFVSVWVTQYNLQNEETQSFDLRRNTFYAGGGNQEIVTYSPNILPSVQQYFLEVKKGMATVESSENGLAIKWK